MLALRLLCDRPQMITSVFSGYAKESNDLPEPGVPYYGGPMCFQSASTTPSKPSPC